MTPADLDRLRAEVGSLKVLATALATAVDRLSGMVTPPAAARHGKTTPALSLAITSAGRTRDDLAHVSGIARSRVDELCRDPSSITDVEIATFRHLLPDFKPSERGAVLIHAAIALAALLAFLLVMIIGQGILLTGRRQAQNSSDASALSGAISLCAWSEGEAAVVEAEALEAARHYGQVNVIWGAAPTVDARIVPCPDNLQPVERPCVFVQVTREFHLITPQRATASAMAGCFGTTARLVR